MIVERPTFCVPETACRVGKRGARIPLRLRNLGFGEVGNDTRTTCTLYTVFSSVCHHQNSHAQQAVLPLCSDLFIYKYLHSGNAWVE